MFAVVETQNGYVNKVWTKEDEAKAREFAKQLCRENGIEYEGDVSRDGNVKNFSIQVVPL